MGKGIWQWAVGIWQWALVKSEGVASCGTGEAGAGVECGRSRIEYGGSHRAGAALLWIRVRERVARGRSKFWESLRKTAGNEGSRMGSREGDRETGRPGDMTMRERMFDALRDNTYSYLCA